MGPRSSVSYVLDNVNTDTVAEAIALHKNSKSTTSALYQRYLQKGLEIQSRTVEDITKPNNQLTNDFRGYIVDQVTGYLFGNEVSYTVDEVSYENAQAIAQSFNNLLDDLITTNEMPDLDAELCTYMSAAGYAARLMYLENVEDPEQSIEESEFPPLRVMNIPAWEIFFVYNGTKRTHAIRYQETAALKEGGEKGLLVTVYTDTELTRFATNEKGELLLVETKPHGFNHIPVALFQNNNEEMCDFEKVEPLIDAYDVVTSDSVNEIEAFAHAYLALEGIEMEKGEAEKAKRTGVLTLPTSYDGQSGKAYFITKNVNDGFLENTKNMLVSNIHKFSSSVNMADESFSGSAQSGESRKWKMMDLEAKAGTKARKFSKGLREQFKVICSNWRIITDGIDYRKISFGFSRNVPQDKTHLAEFATKMKGIISDETLFDNIKGVVDDSKYEKKLIERETSAYSAQLGPLVGDDDAETNS